MYVEYIFKLIRPVGLKKAERICKNLEYTLNSKGPYPRLCKVSPENAERLLSYIMGDK